MVARDVANIIILRNLLPKVTFMLDTLLWIETEEVKERNVHSKYSSLKNESLLLPLETQMEEECYLIIHRKI